MSEASLCSSTGPRPSQARQFDRLCTEFEVAMRDGGRPRIEDFLGDTAEPDRSALLRELVLLEALYRRNRGEPADAGEYEVRFSDEATLIRSAFAEAFQATPPPASGPDITESQRHPGDVSPPHSLEAREETFGTRIGPYKLLQQIGEGGMGTVWMAEQTEPVRRTVALKVVKVGMDTRHAIARFESERQALAIMDHSNIAKILDAGATACGQPYFVMELVKGVPITEFCDKNHLPPEARLKLFLDVCHAIQHAHHKGVIHRDVKPSNVLVTLCDGAPVVKVIDFGIAKALAQKLTESTLFTAYGQMIGTPAYMSPEQAETSGLDIDMRSDVYSLGVLLYELLTGTTPLESKRLREAGFAEMQRLIREEEAPRPSTRVSTLGDSATILAGNRGTDVKRLSHLLAGDLDWIVMKALDKDRNRRYATPERFAEDVERYLRRDVVLARPPSTTYKLRRFAQRNRAAALAAAAVAAALLTGTAVATWQAVRATKAEASATASAGLEKQAKEAALAKEAETAAVLAFVEDHVFAAARPEGLAGGLGHDVMLRKAIEATLPIVAKTFTDQPLVEARLRMTLGTSFLYLGEAGKAAEQFQPARTLYAKHRGPDHRDTLNCSINLAICYGHLGRQADALRLREETLKLHKATFGPDDRGTLLSMVHLADSYSDLGRHTDALKLREETLALVKIKFGPDHSNALWSMMGLAKNYAALGRHLEAQSLLEDTLVLAKTRPDPDHLATLLIMDRVADSYAAAGRTADALSLQEETAARMKARLGPDHPATLGSMGGVVKRLVKLDRSAEALPIIDECVRRAAGRVVEPRLLLELIDLRLRHFVQAKDAAGCRQSAEMWERLNRLDAASLYEAARCRAATSDVLRQTPEADACRLAETEADRAMAWLR